MPTYATNKKARFEYDILETLEAGLVLTGQEVKSLRTKNTKLLGSFITFHNTDAFVTNLHIPTYPYAGHLPNYDPERSRKLLLKKKEIAYLRGKSAEKGLTIIPLSIYTKGRVIKLQIAIVRGKKLHDKRRTIKDRDQKRESRRALKGDY
ncbi:MAG: SsrA-binding protein [Candidatus Magasanikbacteria bacterium CG10_big_fil_rev_8_21_14_0_10_43_6]|uniref:SsrA-binding protein n=1 Tax=Candidatus Magasanikbacteria bacterium CG10_big_fil_rev_8_21_14_0_10_43_6 TaxID=1974650 RepID=A0A2M6W1W4_9BACT|nr:MAG: SsrA-binding protein [Candidatus Magasanikbacteria bacterium CG10_big_fil_rev_8_21_14_0_10_43_6]